MPRRELLTPDERETLLAISKCHQQLAGLYAKIETAPGAAKRQLNQDQQLNTPN